MPLSARRDPTKPGIAGLTVEHVKALDERRITLADIARELGCSRQAVAKALKRRTKPAVEKSAASPFTVPEPRETASPAGPVTPEIIADTLVGANLALLAVLSRETAKIAADPTGYLGPTSAKAIAQSLTLVRENLSAAGLVPESNSKLPTELTIRVMTEEEEAAIRQSVEAEALQERQDGPEIVLPEPEAPAETEPAESAPASFEAPVRFELPTHVKTPDQVRAFLALLAQRQGNVMLRRIAREHDLIFARDTERTEMVQALTARIAIQCSSKKSL